MKQRLHKILASAGIASLRKSERLIAEGRIQVNGQTAKIGDFADQDIDVILLTVTVFLYSRSATSC